MRSVALVPTMGALHAGHLSLIDAAHQLAGQVAVSIFVNPTQFAPHEDFQRYPRPIDDDLTMCAAAGVDLVFHPDVAEIYSPGTPAVVVDLPMLTTTLEGAHRPGHFAGVCQVVAKLFNIITPSAACFGEKDFQQLAVLRAMAHALNFSIEVIGCPTVRESDGLAMSSRNRFLSPAERVRATVISRSLRDVAAQAKAGERDAVALGERLRSGLHKGASDSTAEVAIDYATLVDRQTLAALVGTLDRPAQALVAMRVGSTRLIDNIAID